MEASSDPWPAAGRVSCPHDRSMSPPPSPPSSSSLPPASSLSPLGSSLLTQSDDGEIPAAPAAAVKPSPMDLTHLFSMKTKMRAPSKMKEYYKFFQIPGIGNLAGGLPNVSFFPYDTLEAQIAKPERWTPTPTTAGPDSHLAAATSNLRVSTSQPADRMAPVHLTVPKVTPAAVPGKPAPPPDKKIDLATALQYGTAEGYPPLLTWVRKFTVDHLHPNVPYRDGPDVILTVGSTDGFAKTLELFVDDWNETRDVRERPGLLCETFVYGNVLSQAAPKGMQTVPVEADAAGMLPHGPGSLEDVLANWDDSTGRRPHIMYTVTMGHNPTGIVLSVERRKQIYAVCSRFDVIIVEDDPYWYLQYPSAAADEATSRGLPPPPPPPPASQAALPKSSGYAFLDSLVPSFLSVDVDGRVVRLDTFSKTVAPGCRLGWITAQPALIERFTRITETSTQQPSGFVQSLISELVMGQLPAAGTASPPTTVSKSSGGGGLLLGAFRGRQASNKDESMAFGGWQTDGWVRWLEGLCGEYERRMGRMCIILDAGRFQLKQGTPLRPADADWGVITKTQLYSFDWPRGGMFVWMRIFFEAHPLWMAPRSDGVLDGPALSMALMLLLCSKPSLVLASPGTMFSATDAIRASAGWAYFRLCFAAESDDNIVACSHRLVAGIHSFWRIKRVQDMEEILDSAPAIASAQAANTGQLTPWLGC